MSTPDLRAALLEASKWLHAAYDRPPQTPEAKGLLARIDAALAAPAQQSSDEVRAAVTLLLEANDYGQFADDMLDHPSPSCRSLGKGPVRDALRLVITSHEFAALAAPAQPDPLPGMSPMNRYVAYTAANKLRQLGYEWSGTDWTAQQTTDWREAVLDALTSTGSDMPAAATPAEIVREVIDAHVQIALDPRVSDAAPAQQHRPDDPNLWRLQQGPAQQPEMERDQLRGGQARDVMPLIGPLLDAWDGLPNDEKGSEGLAKLGRQLKAISWAMENAPPSVKAKS